MTEHPPRPITRRRSALAVVLVAVLALVASACDTPTPAAGTLFNDWKAGDQAHAATVATPAAKAQMFSQVYNPATGWAFVTCDGAAGSSYCTWITAIEGKMVLRVDSATSKVTSVTRTSLGSVEAGRVFHAWRVGSQASAAPYSTASARSALFAKSYAVSAHWLPNGCEGAAGSLYCTWTNDAAKTIILRVDQVSSPHLVVSVGGTY